MKGWAHCFEDDCQGSEGTISPYYPCPASPEASLDPCTWTEEPNFSSAWALSPCRSDAVAIPGLSPSLPLSPGETFDPGCSHVSSPVLVSCCLMDLALVGHLPCLRLLTDPITAPGSVPCGQTLGDGACQWGHWVPWGHPGFPAPCPLGTSQVLLHPDSDKDASWS